MATTKTASKEKIVPSKVKKYTTLEDIEKNSKGPLYVINATSNPNGRLTFSIPKASGQGHDPVRIPKTFIPIDISLDATRKRIIDSSEFRTTVAKGLLKLPTREYAELLLNSEEGQEELRRVENERAQLNAVVENMAVREDSDEEEYADVKSAGSKAKSAHEAGPEKAVASINIKLKNLVANANDEDWNETKIVAALRNYGQLTLREIKFLNVKFPSQVRVQRFLKQEYEAIKEEASS